MTPLELLVGTAVLAALLTTFARWIARRTRRFGASGAPIPTLGGPAMLAALSCGLFFSSIPIPIGLIVGALGMALIGLVDDWRPFAPLHKFVLTVLIAATAVGLGIRFDLFGMFWIDAALTVLWMVWLCHAFNVFDMADGLSAGSGVLAAASLYLMGGGDWLLAVAGVLLGFLIHNVHPARLYMGDAGSLLFGFVLSATAVLISVEAGGTAGWVGPFVALGLMTFEGVFVSAVRFAKGRPISRASRDHVAQRLVQRGLSARASVASMWFVGTLLGLVGLGMLRDLLPAWPTFLGVVLVAFWIGRRLSRVDMEGDGCDGCPAGLFEKNWLIHRLMRQAMCDAVGYASGDLLDIGCGQRPYEGLFAEKIARYVGLERDRQRYARADMWGNALDLPMCDRSVDTVLCNQVLEHVPEPQRVMNEIARVLRPGGHLILTAPHIWELHEVPHDYYRYTPYGLRHLAKRAGLVVVDVRALAGFWVTAGARFCYYLARFDRGVFIPFVRVAFLLVQFVAMMLDRMHRVESDAWNYMLIARKS